MINYAVRRMQLAKRAPLRVYRKRVNILPRIITEPNEKGILAARFIL